MPRKNIKVPESLFLALRDDKPEQMSWPAYLERECLTGTDGIERVKEQLEAIESSVSDMQSSVSTVESRTGSIERAVEGLSEGRR